MMTTSELSEQQSSCSVGIATIEKDDLLRTERARIGGFTLMFEDHEMEKKWNMAHLKRNVGITTRYLFVATLFQGNLVVYSTRNSSNLSHV